MRSILDIILFALDLYKDAIIASAIMSWLIAFQVINTRNDIVRAVWNFLDALTTPMLRPIRRFMPNTGSIDLSPVVLFLAVLLVQNVIVRYIYPYVF